MNLSPLRVHGRWLAVTMIAPSQLVSGLTVVMNIAGVVHMPQSSTSQSALVSPRIAAVASRGPDRRESRPTAMVRSAGVLPSFSARKHANT